MKSKIAIPITLLLLAAVSQAGFGQSKIKDGSVTGSTSLPDSNAILELESNKKGLLLPRVALTSLTAPAPLSAHVAGMMIYNTANTIGTTMSPEDEVSPGFYYNDSTKWIKVADAGNVDFTDDAWVNGRSMGDTKVHLGTLSDGTSVRPAGTEFEIKDDGKVGIGLTNPAGTLDIKGKMYVNHQQTIYNAEALGVSPNCLFVGDGGNNDVSGVTGYGGNTSLGIGALLNNTSGDQGTAIGYNALRANTSGNYNTALGNEALAQNTTGYRNLATGQGALYRNTTGNGNTANGFWALWANTEGYYNTATGHNTMDNNSTGSMNTAGGTFALSSNQSGNVNAAFGYKALFGNTTGGGNIGVGYEALVNNSTGSLNTVVGYSSGSDIASGSGNTILGAYVSGLAPDLSNNIILADGAGNQRIRVLDDGKTGIGTITPKSTLEVKGSMAANYMYITGSTALSEANHFVNAGGAGSYTITLPAASSCTGRAYHIRIESSGIAINGSDGGYKNLAGATVTTTVANTAVLLVSSGSQWIQF